MPPRSRQLWQLVAFLVIFTALGINPLAMVPLHVGAVMAIVVFGWRGPWLLRRLARRHARVQRDRSREFGPRAR